MQKLSRQHLLSPLATLLVCVRKCYMLGCQDCTTVEDVAAWLRCLVEAGAAPRGSTISSPFMQITNLLCCLSQDCTTVEDVAAWPPPLRCLVEAGTAPCGTTISFLPLPSSTVISASLQDWTTLEDVAAWPPPLRCLVEAGAMPRGTTT